MALDKSSTHQKVIKNGEEGWIVKPVWEMMVSEKKTNGFSAVANTPPEVELVKQKNKEVVAEPVISVTTETEEKTEVEVKAKPATKAKDADKK